MTFQSVKRNFQFSTVLPLLLSLFVTSYALSSYAGYPEAKNEYLNDYASIIDDAEEKALIKKLTDTEYYSGVEISVLTIKNFMGYQTLDVSFEGFATGLFNHWGVGNLPKNNGVLFIVSLEDRRIRLELGEGYPKHYDEIMQEIIDSAISPLLTEGRYTQGIVKGVDEIISSTTKPVSFFAWYKWKILAAIGVLLSLVIALKVDKEKNPSLFWLSLASAGLFLLFLMRSSGKSSGGFGGGSSRGGGASGGF